MKIDVTKWNLSFQIQWYDIMLSYSSSKLNDFKKYFNQIFKYKSMI